MPQLLFLVKMEEVSQPRHPQRMNGAKWKKIAKVSSQSEASEAVTLPDAFCFPSTAYKVHRPVVSHSLQVYALDSK